MNCLLVEKHCSEAVEYLIIKCRPHYQLRKFTAVVIAAVDIPPDANANAALNKLHEAISSLQNKHPEALYVAAGDFNHVNLQATLPTFHQHVTVATRCDNTHDKVYTNRRGTYRAATRPHLGASDPISIMGNIVNLKEFKESVLAYIAKCVEDVTITKTIIISLNQKPWLNAEMHCLLKVRDAAFRAGDAEALRAARWSLTVGVKRAKSKYSKKIQGHFSSNDPHSMWRGIKSITDYNRKSAERPSDLSLPDALNIFYACFEVSNTSTIARFKISPDDSPLSLTSAEVRKTLHKIKPHKAVGSDGVPGRILRDCAQQLSSVMADP